MDAHRENVPDFLVGLKEISRVTGFSPWEVRQMLRSGMLPGIRVGRSWVAAREWLEAWKSDRRPVVPRPPGGN
jgi:hypothetical protein